MASLWDRMREDWRNLPPLRSAFHPSARPPVQQMQQPNASGAGTNRRPDAAERIRTAYPPPVPGVAAAEGAPFAMQPPQYPERNFDAPRDPLDYLPGASAEQPPSVAVPSPAPGRTLRQAGQLLGGESDGPGVLDVMRAHPGASMPQRAVEGAKAVANAFVPQPDAADNELRPMEPVAVQPLETQPAPESQSRGTLSVVSGRSPEMQSRVDQNVAMLDRQTDALRQLREARNPGVTTGGRGGYEAPPLGVFDRPGDGFGDRQMREAQYQGLLRDAANQRGFGARRRSAAMIDAAEQMRAPGEAAVGADTANRQTQAGERAARMQAESGERTARMEQEGLNQRGEANRLTQLESASIAQIGRIGAEQMKGDAAAQKRSEERRVSAWTDQAKMLKEMGVEDTADFFSWLTGAGPTVLGEMKYDNDQWAAFLAQPSSQEMQKWYALYRRRPQPGLIARTLGTGPTIQQQADRLQGN